MTAAHTILKVEDVIQLGRTLISVANDYPTRFFTERDFFPLVVAYLEGRVPALKQEVSTTEGTLDFRLGGPNPTWLELAVQPRQLSDPNNPKVIFPGHTSSNVLYATQNRSELKKLMLASSGKTRFLLLIDLTGKYDTDTLQQQYKREGKLVKGAHPVQVIYSCLDESRDINFIVKA